MSRRKTIFLKVSYSSITVDILKGKYDNVLMKHFDQATDCYLERFHLLLREERKQILKELIMEKGDDVRACAHTHK